MYVENGVSGLIFFHKITNLSNSEMSDRDRLLALVVEETGLSS